MTRALAAVVTALACAGAAHAAGRVVLPAPLAPLSVAPPLSGGATASAENAAHSVTASTTVLVEIDELGKAFAVTAVQRLDVRGTGDYFFTIGAPVVTVRAPAGSESVPGMRTGAILWAGFNPQRRLLVARAALDPPKVVSTLPLRIRASGNSVVLQNATAVTVTTFTADAPRAPLVAYLASLRTAVAGRRIPLQTSVPLSSVPTPEHVTVVAPLHVEGEIGSRHVDLVLTGRTSIHATGRIDLRVEPLERIQDVTATDGRGLLHAAIRATLRYARVHQYETYLGNPDPVGTSRTVYEYQTASPPHAAPIATIDQHHRSWLSTVLVLGVVAAALLAGAALWSRS
jgi:hypothetical protein